MKSKNPPFEITEKILSDVAEIAELAGKIGSTERLSANPTLRKTNRIKTIHGSLAIEQNTLSIEQITAVLNGKKIIAPPKDIAEVKNAYEIYEHMDMLDPYSIEYLLAAHGVMMRGLVDEAGELRSRPVGVVNGEGKIIHFGTLPAYVPDALENLMNWTKNSELPLLIKSCVFHYEFELIHPFIDGNGRVGRLWHTLLLSKWNALFAWLPVESIIHDRQNEYYEAINSSNEAGESTEFIEFMLSAIKAALLEAAETETPAAGRKTLSEERKWKAAEKYLQKNGKIQNADVCKLLKVSPSTANRLLSSWVQGGRLERFRDGTEWKYRAK